MRAIFSTHPLQTMNTETQGTVVLGFGPQPMDWLSKASVLCGKGAVMDATVARMAGANLAAGTPEALAALRQRLEAGALLVQQQANPGLSEAATRWLAGGERGLSSETIFTHLTGINALNVRDKYHPYDPADLRRCRLLLEQVPELVPLFHKMSTASKEWAALVKSWADLCTTMDAESPDWRTGGGSAPKTYALIKQAIGR